MGKGSGRYPGYARVVAFVAAISIILPVPALPDNDIAIQTQVQYQSFEVKPYGKESTSTGGLSTTYNILIRKPVFPMLRLKTNINLTSFSNSDQLGQQQTRNMSFGASTQELRYNLRFGMDENSFHSISTSGDTTNITNGTNRSYYGNLMWQEPDMPTVNLQYRRNTNKAGSGSSYETSSWVLGGYYDVAPLRFILDRRTTKYDFSSSGNSSGSDTTRSNIGVVFDQPLLPGLSLYGDWGKDNSDTSYSNGRKSSLGGTRHSMRLTAIPTNALLLTAERSAYDSRQDTGFLKTDTKSTITSYSARAEVLPGLSMVAYRQSQEQSGGGVESSSNRTTSVTLNGDIAPDTVASVGWNKSDFSVVGLNTNQSSLFGTLQMPLSATTDLTFDVGTTESAVNRALSHKGRYAGVLLRNNARRDLSYGIGYRWNWSDLSDSSARPKQTDQSVNFIASWLPSSNIGVNANLNYNVTGGRSISKNLSPSVDIRWEPSNNSQLLLRHSFSTLDQFDFSRWAINSQDTSIWTARLTYTLSRDSSFDLSYDLLKSNTGIEWQRSLRMYFTYKL